ncbi:Hypothetical predicted protein [Pelobates cultripes]|uniref:Sodefrin-like factor n=1 Tax=Pelobates cultripes TaxID=61616 RepID=A0AAD1T6Q2_PELCU|nr:Hypothetical predicted protein [Pelobates cultripes]
MSHFLEFIIVLSALTTVTSGLSCVTCTGYGDTTCNGKSVTCTAGHVCASAYIMTTGGTTSIRSCEPENKCNLAGTMTLSGTKMYMATLCCSTDNCSPPEPTGNMTSSSSIFGCGTSSLCEIDSYSANGQDETVDVTFKCYSAGSGLYYGISFLLTALLLLLKSIF